MTDLSPQAGAWEPLPSRPQRRFDPFYVLALLAVVLSAALIYVIFFRDDSEDHPAAWDERVADLASYVEEERGLAFDHPVAVEFMSNEEFRKEVSVQQELTEAEQAEMESMEAGMRAMGLISGDIDMVEAGNELRGDGVAGFYEPRTKRIVIRGLEKDGELPTTLRATLVHELTHALQDQHFELMTIETEDSGEAAALQAVVEADAELVREAWVDELPEFQQEQLAKQEAEGPGGEEMDFEDVPPVFVELMSFPYIFGPDFLQEVIDERGEKGRNAVMEDLPTTEEHIVLPETYLDREEPVDVPLPDLEEGEEPIKASEGDFGMTSLLVVLAERVDFSQAWPAVQGWAGDASRAFERDGTTCVRTTVAFDDRAEAAEFGEAFAAWSKGRPAEHEVDGDRVRFESCDPGEDVDQTRPEGQMSGVQGLAFRRMLIEQLRAPGVSDQLAACVADGLFERISGNRLLELDKRLRENPEDPALQEIQQTMIELMGECGGPTAPTG